MLVLWQSWATFNTEWGYLQHCVGLLEMVRVQRSGLYYLWQGNFTELPSLSDETLNRGLFYSAYTCTGSCSELEDPGTPPKMVP